MAKQSNIPSVLAYEKKLVPSDGYLFGTQWENKDDPKQCRPLKLIEKSVRGTISNRLKSTIKNDAAKLDAEVEKANLQTVDSCALGMNEDTLKLHFTLKVLSGLETPSACNGAEFLQKYQEAVNQYLSDDGFAELGKRYAINLANGRFLWRNRVGAEEIEVRIQTLNLKENKSFEFNASDFSLKNFKTDNEQVLELGKLIALALSGKEDFLMLEIDAFAKSGFGQDVYPSEELVLDKGKSKKSKILYHIDGIAGMHSQKIGNAVRSVDTWYPEFSDPSAPGPIALEPYGAVTNMGKAFRNPKDKADFYTLFDQFAQGGSISEEEKHYVMGILVRGGVFGESSKD